MKNILVATDFSNNAYCALFYAAKLLASKLCVFHILNVYNENIPLLGNKTKLFSGKKYLNQLEIESTEKLTSTLHRIVTDNENPKHQFKILSRKGVVSKVIATIVHEKHIDLAVMGNKGLTEATDIFFGSNTIRTVKKITKCPVLAVPGEIHFTAPKEIAFITDFKKSCEKEAISPLLFLASLSNAAIRIMHINEEEILTSEQESQRKLLELCLKDVDHSFHWMQAFDDKAKVIDVFLKNLNIDLYAMVNHRHNLFEKLTHEPIIKDVSMYSQTPFLILPPQD